MKKRSGEVTSARVATIAGRVLERLNRAAKVDPSVFHSDYPIHFGGLPIATLSDLKALCASALTQTKDKPVKTARK